MYVWGGVDKEENVGKWFQKIWVEGYGNYPILATFLLSLKLCQNRMYIHTQAPIYKAANSTPGNPESPLPIC